MNAVHWLLQTSGDVPAGPEWLSGEERACLAQLRFPKRRADWRLGRWTGKLGLCAFLGEPPETRRLAGLQIRADADGAPVASRGGRPLPCVLSLSHRAGAGICAVAGAGVAVGCDLEHIEPRDASFAADFFAASELALLGSTPGDEHALLATLIWSAKESALKALRQGLRRDTRSVIVRLSDAPSVDGWHALTVDCVERTETFRGWWRHYGDRLVTLVSRPAPARPLWRGVGGEFQAGSA